MNEINKQISILFLKSHGLTLTFISATYTYK